MGTQQNSFQLNYADRNLTAVAEKYIKDKSPDHNCEKGFFMR